MGTGASSINVKNGAYYIGNLSLDDFLDTAQLTRTDEHNRGLRPSEQKFWQKLTPCLKVKRVIYSNPATIVLWQDGTKSVVKCMDGQPYDEYSGFCSAVVKKVFGSTSKAKKIAGLKEKPVKVKIEEPVVDDVSQYGGSISCTNIEGLSCGDYDQSVTDGQSHQDNGVTLTAE